MEQNLSILQRVLKFTIFLTLIIFLSLHFFRPVETEDIWWHINTGDWILKNKKVPHYDIFSFTKEKAPGICTQWLGSCIYSLMYKIGKISALKTFRLFLFILILGIFYFKAYKSIPYILLNIITISMAYGLGTRCLLRPFVFNLIFVQLFLIILFNYQKYLNNKILIFIPLIGSLWINIHLGSFVYGLLLIFIFTFSNIIQFFNLLINNKEINKITFETKKIKDLFLTLICYIVIFILNPYGLKGAIYPFKVFFDPGFIDFYKWRHLLKGFKPPTYILSFPGLWFWIITLICITSFIFCIKNCKKGNNYNSNLFLKLLLFSISLFIFISGERGSGFYTIIAGYIILENFKNISLNNFSYSLKPNKLATYVSYFLILFFLFTAILRLYNQKAYFNNETRRKIFLNYYPYNPVSSINILKKNNINGGIFTDIMNGGYINWAGYPGLKAFVDGRQLEFNRKLFYEYKKIVDNPIQNWGLAEKKYNFKIALIDSTLASGNMLMGYLTTIPSWQLIYIDGIYLIYVKRGEFNLPKKLNMLENNFKSVKISPSDFKRLKEIKTKNKSFMHKIRKIFNPPYFYIDLIEEGKILDEIGYTNAGIKRIINSLDVDEEQASKLLSFNVN